MIRTIIGFDLSLLATAGILFLAHVHGKAHAFAMLLIIVLVVALACSISRRSEL